LTDYHPGRIGGTVRLGTGVVPAKPFKGAQLIEAAGKLLPNIVALSVD